jgi:transposase
MYEAVLSIDVSLDQLDVALRTNDSGWQWPHRAYSNNQPGFEKLKAKLLAELGQQPAGQLTVVAESTGPYWWPAFYQLAHDADLASYQLQLAVLNPQHVKRFRKALPEQDKSDLLDPQLIDRYYQAFGVKHFYQFNDRYLPLRFLTRAYARIIHCLAAEKAYLRSLLFIYASDYQRLEPFSDLFGATSLHILDEFDDIQSLADMPLDELTDQLRLFSGNTLSGPHHKAQKLQQLASQSFPLPQPLAASLHAIVQLSIAHIRFLSDNQKTMRRLIEQQLQQLPEANLALQQPGLGPILVAGCLSEIQDTTRFITGDKFDRKLKRQRPRTYRDGQAAVAKLAGLWWPQRDSGRFQADERHLAQERNPYLRFWLVQAAYTLQRYDPDYTAFYWRKFYEVRAHQHKRALILTARKAVRLIFALLHKGQRACLKEVTAT